MQWLFERAARLAFHVPLKYTCARLVNGMRVCARANADSESVFTMQSMSAPCLRLSACLSTHPNDKYTQSAADKEIHGIVAPLPSPFFNGN